MDHIMNTGMETKDAACHGKARTAGGLSTDERLRGTMEVLRGSIVGALLLLAGGGCTFNVAPRPVEPEDVVVAAGDLIESGTDRGRAKYAISQVLRGQIGSTNVVLQFFSHESKASALPARALLVMTRNDPLRRPPGETTRLAEDSPKAVYLYALGFDSAIGILPCDERTRQRVLKELPELVETPPGRRLTSEAALKLARDCAALNEWRVLEPGAVHKERRYTHGWIVTLKGQEDRDAEGFPDSVKIIIGDDSRIKSVLREAM